MGGKYFQWVKREEKELDGIMQGVTEGCSDIYSGAESMTKSSTVKIEKYLSRCCRTL